MTKIIYFNYNYNVNFKEQEREEHLNSFLDDLDRLGAKYSLSKTKDYIYGEIRNVHQGNINEIELIIKKCVIDDNIVIHGDFHY